MLSSLESLNFEEAENRVGRNPKPEATDTIAPEKPPRSPESLRSQEKQELVEKHIVSGLPVFLQELQAISEYEGIEEAEIIYKFLRTYCFDPGTAIPRCFIAEDEVLENGPVDIPNRTSLIKVLTETYGFPEQAMGKAHIAIFDLQKIRSADLAVDAEGNSSADLIISQAAQALIEKAAQINEELEKEGKPGNIIVARYGGDEFAVLFNSISNETERREIYEKLINTGDGVQSIDGFFLHENGSIKKEPVKIKGDYEEIGIPENPDEAQVFWEQLEKGQIVKPSQLQDVLKFGKEETVTSLSGVEKSTLNEVISQLDRHTQAHPEFASILVTAAQLSHKLYPTENLAQERERYQEFLLRELANFVNENVYDRLLGEYVGNAGNLVEHFTQNPPNSLIIYDVKGLKETNDTFGLAKGDELIIDAWVQIRDALEGANSGEVRIYRIGGNKFIVAAQNADSLNKEVINKLTNVESASVKVGTQVSTFNLGKTTVKVDAEHAPKTSAQLGRFLNENFRTSDKEWSKKLILANINNPELFVDPNLSQDTPHPDLEAARSGRIAVSNPAIYIPKYLYGKRREEHLKTFSEAIAELMNEEIADKEVVDRETQKEAFDEEKFAKLATIRNIITGNMVEYAGLSDK